MWMKYKKKEVIQNENKKGELDCNNLEGFRS